MNRIKGVIFDLDGVITETSEYHYMAWKLLASNIGIYIDRELNEKLKGVSRMDSLDIILKHGHRDHDFSDAEKTALATSKNNRYVEMINQFTKKDLLEGVEELLCELKVLGIKIGIASASHSAKKLIGLMGIESLVDYIVDPGSVPSKPAPDIFIKAAEGLGLEPSECIGVEDAVAGIKAIKAAKMYAVGIGDKEILHEADRVYSWPSEIRMTELLNSLQS